MKRREMIWAPPRRNRNEMITPQTVAGYVWVTFFAKMLRVFFSQIAETCVLSMGKTAYVDTAVFARCAF